VQLKFFLLLPAAALFPHAFLPAPGHTNALLLTLRCLWHLAGPSKRQYLKDYSILTLYYTCGNHSFKFLGDEKKDFSAGLLRKIGS